MYLLLHQSTMSFTCCLSAAPLLLNHARPACTSPQQKRILGLMLSPEKCLHFLRPGRLVKVREGRNNWGWGVVVSVSRR